MAVIARQEIDTQLGTVKASIFFTLTRHSAFVICSELAKLHQTSVSPTGKFGFHIATAHKKLPRYMVWTSKLHEHLPVIVLSSELQHSIFVLQTK